MKGDDTLVLEMRAVVPVTHCCKHEVLICDMQDPVQPSYPQYPYVTYNVTVMSQLLTINVESAPTIVSTLSRNTPGLNNAFAR